MDIVFGGGKYGSEAVDFLLENGRSFVVLDVDENCVARKKFGLPEYDGTERNSFLKGGIKELLDLIEKLSPEFIFPTAPIHLAGALVMNKYGLKTWNEGVDFILSGLPSRLVVSSGRGSVVVSYNRDEQCLPNCSAPDVCPVTKIKKPAPMYEMVGFAMKDGFVVKSHYLKPGLGAIKGNDLLKLFEWAESRDKVFVATACRCHGVITALRRD